MTDSESIRELAFQNSVYTLTTLKKAAYRLSDRCSFEFEVSGDTTVCRLRFKPSATHDFMRDTIDDFHREVLDQDLRQIVADETAPLRNVILSHAFSKTGLQS
jgi:His-Xaa-Ser system protein HxsD